VSIAGLVDQEAMAHLAKYGFVKNMDPYALHLLKHSNHPLLRFRRAWIRAEALRQCQEAHRQQPAMNQHLAGRSLDRRSTLRCEAIIHPWFKAEMERRHNTTWDRDFRASVREAHPGLFPRRGN
jgi:hypothetical protein